MGTEPKLKDLLARIEQLEFLEERRDRLERVAGRFFQIGELSSIIADPNAEKPEFMIEAADPRLKAFATNLKYATFRIIVTKDGKDNELDASVVFSVWEWDSSIEKSVCISGDEAGKLLRVERLIKEFEGNIREVYRFSNISSDKLTAKIWITNSPENPAIARKLDRKQEGQRGKWLRVDNNDTVSFTGEQPGKSATIHVREVAATEGNPRTVELKFKTGDVETGNALINDGRKGDVGPQGAQGPQGDVGPQGVQGPKGDVGPQGAQGPKGDVGPQGAQGPKGDVGATKEWTTDDGSFLGVRVLTGSGHVNDGNLTVKWEYPDINLDRIISISCRARGATGNSFTFVPEGKLDRNGDIPKIAIADFQGMKFLSIPVGGGSYQLREYKVVVIYEK